MESPPAGQAIIISTGRCGSTLLSDLIAKQSDTLSAHEFFASVETWTSDRGVLSGAEYWSRLSSPRPELATLFRIGLGPAEVCYPADGRWAGNLVELPRILATTLPKISSDPDRLFDILAELVPGFPAQPLARHHQMFLDLLTSLAARRRWVERSGGSSHLARYLLEEFPTAKIVYLTRNREDTARSMSRHSSFQLLQLNLEFLGQYGVDPFHLGADQQVPEELERYLPSRLTAETLSERGRDVQRYRRLCAFLTSEAEQAITDAGPRDLLTMTYEDLVDDPLAQLARLGRFLDFDDWEQWARQVAGAVEPGPRQCDAAAIA
ncbi:sulfotransferase domain-containing protein [Plantactinospora sp. KLBMP9567]|uniref:sulfotransferase domain-containing protein n=1 Tax=Plantactinospora sp. KLBMP9567 TaxID=3085900 RepID=UPI0029812546|nr:sulfotransferase domain-containing protein [Plantactinospora sp. KLBMP9567]MDW5326950.1 sulfotransferase [Plantactinospora sp. KLBMP9567]